MRVPPTVRTALLLTLLSPALAHADAGPASPPSLSMSDLYNTEVNWGRELSLLPHRPLYWAAAGEPTGRSPECIPSTTATDHPLSQAGSYLDCVMDAFPLVNYIDDLPQTGTTPDEPEVRNEISCRSGNFVGTVKTTYQGRRPFRYTVTQYRIQRLNGQSGGNKANINIGVRTNQHEGTWAIAMSGDNLIQDGYWHDLNLTAQDWRTSNYYYTYVTFVFDKSGADPSCSTGENGLYAGP